MNWDRIEGNWKQLKGRVRVQWGKLTEDHLDVIAGQREQLVGRVQEQYGIGKDEAEKQVDRFASSLKEEDFKPRMDPGIADDLKSKSKELLESAEEKAKEIAVAADDKVKEIKAVAGEKAKEIKRAVEKG